MECVEMNLKTVDTYLNYKLDENSDFILLTFYELRVKLNLSQTDTNEFINLSAKLSFFTAPKIPSGILTIITTIIAKNVTFNVVGK